MSDNRRIWERIPIGCRVLLTPIDQDGSLLIEDNVAFLGLDVSEGGICFCHNAPLPRNRFLLAFRDAAVGGIVLEAEVVWTRTMEAGRLATGCRIVRKLLTAPTSEPSQLLQPLSAR